MSKPIITKQMLIDADACSDQVDLFEKTFGDSVVVTVKRAEKVAHLFRWGWASCLLDAQGRAELDRARAAAWAEYDRVEAAALAEYERVIAPALAEYERVRAAAWAEYERVTATAWASAFIDMHKRGAIA
jgi:hypothetical protein